MEAAFGDKMGGSMAYCKIANSNWLVGEDDEYNRLKLKLNIIKKLESSVENTIIIAKGDSGATNHYWRPEDTNCLQNVNNVKGQVVILPYNTAVTANQEGTISTDNSLSYLA